MQKIFFLSLFLLSSQLFAAVIENLESGESFNIVSQGNSYYVSGNGEEFTVSKSKLANTFNQAEKALESGGMSRSKVDHDQFMLYTNIVTVKPILYESFVKDNDTGVTQDQFKLINDVLNAIK